MRYIVVSYGPIIFYGLSWQNVSPFLAVINPNSFGLVSSFIIKASRAFAHHYASTVMHSYNTILCNAFYILAPKTATKIPTKAQNTQQKSSLPKVFDWLDGFSIWNAAKEDAKMPKIYFKKAQGLLYRVTLSSAMCLTLDREKRNPFHGRFPHETDEQHMK